MECKVEQENRSDGGSDSDPSEEAPSLDEPVPTMRAKVKKPKERRRNVFKKRVAKVPERQVMKLPRPFPSLNVVDKSQIRNLPMIMNLIHKARQAEEKGSQHKSEAVLAAPKLSYSFFKYPAKAGNIETREKASLCKNTGDTAIPQLERKPAYKSIPKTNPPDISPSWQKPLICSRNSKGNILIPSEVFITNSSFIANFLCQHKKRSEAVLRSKAGQGLNVQSGKVSPAGVSGPKYELVNSKRQF
eukprot:TRINITY_DN8442_c0_g3_i5.p1 TRINITY_DN8442_c0_g3~~TRINITY_DN8442_c0_g3_i5.p1  ORF type:complete len:245 (-),score=44.90 TRINITY_DN8442_c0_g3_i5:284-1018(-)